MNPADLADVGYGSKGEILSLSLCFRYSSNAGHLPEQLACPRSAIRRRQICLRWHRKTNVLPARPLQRQREEGKEAREKRGENIKKFQNRKAASSSGHAQASLTVSRRAVAGRVARDAKVLFPVDAPPPTYRMSEPAGTEVSMSFKRIGIFLIVFNVIFSSD